jgi:hypothetical protein
LPRERFAAALPPCKWSPWKGFNLYSYDWVWSIAFYTAAIMALIGLVGIIRPLRRVHRGRRTHAAVMMLIGLAAMYAISRSMPRAQTSTATNAIDAYTPAFHFRELHETTIAAPPDRVYLAVRQVSADEIALFQTFTWLRRFGRSGPESILNAPGQQPILDVATRTTFRLLEDLPPREVVIGAVVVAPPGTRGGRGKFDANDFKQLMLPGFAKATLNFRIEALANGASKLITETRVFATDAVALQRFTPYWRIIFPGSAILRLTWLRAIKSRAERAS